MTKPKTAKAPPPPVVVDKSRHLEMVGKPGQSEDRLMADLIAHGVATNASTALRYVQAEHGPMSLTDMVRSLTEQGEAVNRGDMATAERMLSAQAVALNAIFAELARVAHSNLFRLPDVTDRYLRLALKAQSQSRATVETLAAIKNPPTVFARQANINNGGQQQVNNGPNVSDPTSTRTPTRARQTDSPPSKLLEADTGKLQEYIAKGSAGGTSPDRAPVGALDSIKTTSTS